MANPENLNPPWEKGQSGNPDGRPKGAKDGLRAAFMRDIRKDAPADMVAYIRAKGIDIESGANTDIISLAIVRSACKGDIESVKTILKETELPIPREHKVEHSGNIDHNGGLSRLDEILADFGCARQGDDDSGDVPE